MKIIDVNNIHTLLKKIFVIFLCIHITYQIIEYRFLSQYELHYTCNINVKDWRSSRLIYWNGSNRFRTYLINWWKRRRIFTSLKIKNDNTFQRFLETITSGELGIDRWLNTSDKFILKIFVCLLSNKNEQRSIFVARYTTYIIRILYVFFYFAINNIISSKWLVDLYKVV